MGFMQEFVNSGRIYQIISHDRVVRINPVSCRYTRCMYIACVCDDAWNMVWNSAHDGLSYIGNK